MESIGLYNMVNSAWTSIAVINTCNKKNIFLARIVFFPFSSSFQLWLNGWESWDLEFTIAKRPPPPQKNRGVYYSGPNITCISDARLPTASSAHFETFQEHSNTMKSINAKRLIYFVFARLSQDCLHIGSAIECNPMPLLNSPSSWSGPSFGAWLPLLLLLLSRAF